MRDLEGKNAIITGTNRGIGNAIMHAFALAGCNIWAGVRDVENKVFLDEIDTLAKENNINITPIYLEMSDENVIKDTFQKIYKSHVPIDILVNSAGIAEINLFSMTSMKKMREIFEVNFWGAVYLTQLVLKSMYAHVRKIDRNIDKSIVNIASIAGLDANPGNSSYGVSKAALIHFTKILASEVGQSGIRVNAIAPGFIDTDMLNEFNKKVDSLNWMRERFAMQRYGKPEEIANLAVFLASERSSFINGEIIRIDGGSK